MKSGNRLYRLNALLVLVLCLGSAVTQAATVLLNGTNASGILGLEVQGVFYDVEFMYFDGPNEGPYDAFGPGDIFAGDSTGASAAVSAISDALNLAGGETVGRGISGNGAITFIVPYQIGQGCQEFCAYRGFNTTGDWFNNGDADIDEFAEIEFARFTPAVGTVPVPPALYLFASGLGLLLAKSRRKKG